MSMEMEMEMKMRKERADYKAHVVVVPYPTQGHINPMLQFSKRLVSKGLKITLANTTFTSKTMLANSISSDIELDTISDGFDEKGHQGAQSFEEYLERFKTVGSQTLSDLIKKLETNGRGPPVCGVVYDAFIPWVLDVTKELGLIGVSFFTQSCSVNNMYYHVQRGLLKIPVEADDDKIIRLPGLPPLEMSDLPSFVAVPDQYPSVFPLLLNQFLNFHEADCILVNTFDQMEPEVVSWMSKQWPIKTIGPTVPSVYLDNRVEGDTDYGLNLFKPNTETCMNWLNTKKEGSVVYASVGSLATLTIEQMEELAWGLRGTNNYFLWVVRETEKNKIPENFLQETADTGLVVSWCPQLEVLSHKAVGCFVTHCGWNSTLEALSLGVPMVALPQWTDQPTNAKFVEDEWKVGVRVRADDKGISTRTVIEAGIREIMEGEAGKEIRRNAKAWKELTKEAMEEGGSSDKNIEEFVSKLCCDTPLMTEALT